MSELFDPYHKWLGIPPAEQPPNHYRLLGLNLFESDPDVIENGSDRQMTHLRSFQTGPRMKECQRLLNEVAAARVLLLEAQKKAAYDQLLRATSVPAESPPNATAVPLTPASTLPPTASQPAAIQASSPVVVAKGARRKRKQAIGLGPKIAGGIVGLVMLLTLGYGIRKAFQSSPPSVAPPRQVTEMAPGGPTEPTDAPVVTPRVIAPPAVPPPSAPAPPTATAADPALPTNVLVDVRDEYECTLNSQPQIALDSSFDAAQSWRLSLRIDASSRPLGTLLCWGDGRAGKDPICIQAGPDFIAGWVMDNFRSDGATALPRMPIDWSGVCEIEIVHDAASQVLQMRVGKERRNVDVLHPPRADRPMPIHLGGIGMGALHAYPCNIHDLRLEPLIDPVNLPPPSKLAVAPSDLAGSDEPTTMPESGGSLGDLVNPPKVSKLPIPDDSELRDAREQIQSLFANELSQQRTAQESATLAEKLLAQASQPETEPALRYVLLENAIDVASRGGAVDAASRSLRALDVAFEIDLVQLKTGAAQQLARVAREAWEHKAVVELLEVVIAECLADDRFELATSVAEAAVSAARKSKDSSAISRSVAQSREIKSLNAKYEPVREALELLADGSDDPAASETVGRHLCLVKGKWDKGLPYLVKSDASELREIAARDMRNPTSADSQAEIGNGWMNAAKQLDRNIRLHALLRAEYWYRLAVVQQAGLKKLPLETHIKAVGKEVGELAELPTGAVLVMTFEPNTLKRQGFVLDASQHGYVGIVKGAVFTEGIAGNALGFDGKDDYVEVASTRWLSSPPAFTLSAWVNVVAWKDTTKDMDYVISKDDGKSRRAHGYVLRYRKGGTLNFTLASSGWRYVTSATKAALGEWHHTVATYDGQTYKLFIDGERDGDEVVMGAIDPSNMPLRIGQGAYSKDRGTRGRIDEVAIFNRALSSDEVRTVFRIGQAGRPLIE
ncbi:MAG: LamG domain-containing protein [Planctomycetes bacterium]|nr:LamG domain-containing protein [Planctomycetota bacterium]